MHNVSCWDEACERVVVALWTFHDWEAVGAVLPEALTKKTDAFVVGTPIDPTLGWRAMELLLSGFRSAS